MSVYREGFYAKEMIENSSILLTQFNEKAAPVNPDDVLVKLANRAIECYGVKDEMLAKYPKENIKMPLPDLGTKARRYIHLMDEWRTGDEFIYCITYRVVRAGFAHAGHQYQAYMKIRLVETIKNTSRKPCDNDI